MRRREFIALVGGGVAAWPLAAQPQPAPNVARIGYLAMGSIESPEVRAVLDALRQGLAEFGYIEGRNIIIEARGADGMVERLPALAAELVKDNVDVLVVSGTTPGLAAQKATATIPIVVNAMGDPVRDGLVASLAHPGGNITGTGFLGPQLISKRLGLLKELCPGISRLALLSHPEAFGKETTAAMLKETSDAAKSLGVQLQFLTVHKPDELERAFSDAVGEHADAMLEFPSPMLFAERKRLVELAALNRLPTMFNAREFVQLGGLVAYGTNIQDLYRHAGPRYIDKILKGAKPSDLPVEEPTKFELFINLKTAKALNITVPYSMQLLADEVIE